MFFTTPEEVLSILVLPAVLIILMLLCPNFFFSWLNNRLSKVSVAVEFLGLVLAFVAISLAIVSIQQSNYALSVAQSQTFKEANFTTASYTKFLNFSSFHYPTIYVYNNGYYPIFLDESSLGYLNCTFENESFVDWGLGSFTRYRDENQGASILENGRPGETLLKVDDMTAYSIVYPEKNTSFFNKSHFTDFQKCDVTTTIRGVADSEIVRRVVIPVYN